MKRTKIILKNGKEIVVGNVSPIEISEALNKQPHTTNMVTFLTFDSDIVVCIQDISAMVEEDIKENDNN